MKIKTFIMVCLLLGIGLTQVSAQNSESKHNYSISEKYQVRSAFPIYCDNVWVEYLIGILDVHYVSHFKDGVLEYTICRFSGEYISKTGEVFQSHEEAKVNPDNGVYSYHGNLVGNRGSRYIIFGTIYMSSQPWIFTFERTICHQNVKE